MVAAIHQEIGIQPNSTRNSIQKVQQSTNKTTPFTSNFTAAMNGQSSLPQRDNWNGPVENRLESLLNKGKLIPDLCLE